MWSPHVTLTDSSRPRPHGLDATPTALGPAHCGGHVRARPAGHDVYTDAALLGTGRGRLRPNI